MTWAASLGVGPSILLVLAVAAVPLVAAVGLRLRAGRPEPWRAGPTRVAARRHWVFAGHCCVRRGGAGGLGTTRTNGTAGVLRVPKARLLYERVTCMSPSGRFSPGTTYPPFVPLVHGAAFAFMGASDDVSLHLQTALFFVAFVHGVATISRRFASDLYVVPFALLLATMPEVLNRALQPDGDYPTEFAFVLGALCCVIFLREPARWPLVYAALLLAPPPIRGVKV